MDMEEVIALRDTMEGPVHLLAGCVRRRASVDQYCCFIIDSLVGRTVSQAAQPHIWGGGFSWWSSGDGEKKSEIRGLTGLGHEGRGGRNEGQESKGKLHLDGGMCYMKKSV